MLRNLHELAFYVAAVPQTRLTPKTYLAHLAPLDVAIIAVYFAMVIYIGFYLKSRNNTSEEFFLAGREMTAWIAGLSFISANMGSLELMGWAPRPTNTAFWRRTGTGSERSRPCSFSAW